MIPAPDGLEIYSGIVFFRVVLVLGLLIRKIAPDSGSIE